jgi:hypothetical protein
VRLGLGAFLLVGRELLVPRRDELIDHRVALLRELLGVAVDRREELLGLAERPLVLVDRRAVEDRQVARRLLVGLGVEVAEAVAVLAAVGLGLFGLLVLLRLGLALIGIVVSGRPRRPGVRSYGTPPDPRCARHHDGP